MYVSNYVDMFKPPPEIMAKCTCVIIDANKYKPKALRNWARENCDSLVWWETIDRSPASGPWGIDLQAEFYFILEVDATLFSLKWL